MAKTGGGRDERRAALIRWEGACQGFKWRTCLALVPVCARQVSAAAEVVGRSGGELESHLSEQLTFIDSQIGEGRIKKLLFDAGLGSDLCNLSRCYKGLCVKDYDDGDGEKPTNDTLNAAVWHNLSLTLAILPAWFLFVWPSVFIDHHNPQSVLHASSSIFFFQFILLTRACSNRTHAQSNAKGGSPSPSCRRRAFIYLDNIKYG